MIKVAQLSVIDRYWRGILPWSLAERVTYMGIFYFCPGMASIFG